VARRPVRRPCARRGARGGGAVTHLASGGALACVLWSLEGAERLSPRQLLWRRRHLAVAGNPVAGSTRIGYGVTHSGTVVAHAWQRGLCCCCWERKSG
jgi:hypothetical protein